MKNCSFVRYLILVNYVKFRGFLKKLSVPFIFFLLSLLIFYIGVDTEQDKYFYIGASLVLSASVLTALFSLGILNKKILIAFSILGSFLSSSFYLLYW